MYIDLDRIVVGCPSQENNNYLNENPPEPIPHIRNTPQCAPTYPYSFKVYFSPTSPLLVLSTPKKTQQMFGFTRLFDLNMKAHFKTTRGKADVYHPEGPPGGSSPFPWSVSEVDA